MYLNVSIDMTVTLKQLEKISKALGDVNRLKILQLIAKHGGIGQCAAIQESIDLAQPSVSHHIKILIEAGLIEAQKEGRNHKYILNKDTFDAYLQAMNSQVLAAKA
ncbi:regulatory protein ArsR [Flammeovirgaceae bacterium 311]|nr:regulatory protein ArsR [Flammeovirgaceae bacterium 311]